MSEAEMKNIGNSNRITRDYIDSLRIETRYMDSTNPDPTYTLFGETFASPIMTAALSHLNQFMFEGASKALAVGAQAANAALWIGMAEEEEIEMCVSTGAKVIEIIKPYADRELIYKKMKHAEAHGLLAVGVDIDHPFCEDGSPDVVHGHPMKALTTAELSELCKESKLPFIVKGVLSAWDAERSLAAGVSGMVLSHHNNRIEYAVPPLMMLPEIAKLTNGQVPLFVDCEIRTGMDAFKALALGASGVCIGRPLMAALRKDSENGVKEYLEHATAELKQAMAYTACTTLAKMDPSVIHRA